MRLLRKHTPIVNPVSDHVFATGFNGALKPHDCLVDPMVVTCWIDLRLVTTDRRLDDALLALIHYVVSPRFNQASVTTLSIMCT
jgi:hypothetical protein